MSHLFWDRQAGSRGRSQLINRITGIVFLATTSGSYILGRVVRKIPPTTECNREAISFAKRQIYEPRTANWIKTTQIAVALFGERVSSSSPLQCQQLREAIETTHPSWGAQKSATWVPDLRWNCAAVFGKCRQAGGGRLHGQLTSDIWSM